MVLVFGESANDTASIKALVEALNPALAPRVETRRRPLVLIRDASARELPSRARQVASVVASERVVRDVHAVLAHEDADAPEPAHVAIAEKIERALEREGCAAIAVVPAWETEAWWFLWPDATGAVRSGWRDPDDYVGRNVGAIQNAKEELRRVLVRHLPVRDRARILYQESDSPKIAAEVRRRACVGAAQANSASFQRFADKVRAL